MLLYIETVLHGTDFVKGYFSNIPAAFGSRMDRCPLSHRTREMPERFIHFCCGTQG
jgi:hypothetical protein